MSDIENCMPPELGSQFVEQRGGTDRRLAYNPEPQAQCARFIIGLAASTENLHADSASDPELRSALQLVLTRFNERYPQYLENIPAATDDFRETAEQHLARVVMSFLDNTLL